MENFKIGDVVKASSRPMCGSGYQASWEIGIKEIGSNALGIVYAIKPQENDNTLYGVQWFRGRMAKSFFGHYLQSSKNENLNLFTKTGYSNCWWTQQNVLEKFDFKEEGKALGGLCLCENDGANKYARIGDRVLVSPYEIKGTVVAIRNVNCNKTPDYYYGIRFDNVKYPEGLILNPLLGLLNKNDNSGKWLPKEYFSVIHRISILTGDKEPIAQRKTITCEEEILKKIRKLFTI